MPNYASVPSSKTRKAGRIRTKFETDEKFYQEMNASLTDFLANDNRDFQYPISHGTLYPSPSPPKHSHIKQNIASQYQSFNPDSNVASTLFPDDPLSRRKESKQTLATNFKKDNSTDLKIFTDIPEYSYLGEHTSSKHASRWTPTSKKDYKPSLGTPSTTKSRTKVNLSFHKKSSPDMHHHHQQRDEKMSLTTSTTNNPTIVSFKDTVHRLQLKDAINRQEIAKLRRVIEKYKNQITELEDKVDYLEDSRRNGNKFLVHLDELLLKDKREASRETKKKSNSAEKSEEAIPENLMNWIRELKTQVKDCEKEKAQLKETINQLLFEKQQLFRSQISNYLAPGVELDLEGNYQTRESLDTPNRRLLINTFPSNKQSQPKSSTNHEYSLSLKAAQSYVSPLNPNVNRGNRFNLTSSPAKQNFEETHTQEQNASKAVDPKLGVKRSDYQRSKESPGSKSVEKLNKIQKDDSDIYKLSFCQENDLSTDDLLKRVTKKLRDLNVIPPLFSDTQSFHLENSFVSNNPKNNQKIEDSVIGDKRFETLLTTQDTPKVFISSFEKAFQSSFDESKPLTQLSLNFTKPKGNVQQKAFNEKENKAYDDQPVNFNSEKAQAILDYIKSRIQKQ